MMQTSLVLWHNSNFLPYTSLSTDSYYQPFHPQQIEMLFKFVLWRPVINHDPSNAVLMEIDLELLEL